MGKKVVLLFSLAVLLCNINILADEFESKNFSYQGFNFKTTSETTAALTYGEYSGICFIPNTACCDDETYTVTSIFTFGGSSELTGVVLPSSIISIGESAFADCPSPGWFVIIPQSVTYIGERAFLRCTGLKDIYIPSSVEFIGPGAFYECTGLESITYDAKNATFDGGAIFGGCSSVKNFTIGKDVESFPNRIRLFYGLTSLETLICCAPNCSTDSNANNSTKNTGLHSLQKVVFIDGVEKIPDSLFGLCENLSSIEFSNTITSIGASAFFSCDRLDSIVIPNSITEIGRDAFSSCRNLTEVKLGNSVEIIGASAFYWTGLKTIEIPNSVTDIGASAFDLTPLDSAKLGNSVKYVGDFAFPTLKKLEISDLSNWCQIKFESTNARPKAELLLNNEYLTDIEIPETVTEIGNYVFYDIPTLNSVVIPNSVTSIGKLAFKSCKGLNKVEIPNSVTYLGTEAFSRCTSLTTAVIGNSVEDIKSETFFYCENLTSVVIGSSVSSIGREAFNGCSKIKEIYSLNTTPPTIKNLTVFYSIKNKKNTTLYVPEEAVDAYKEAEFWKEFTIVGFDATGINSPSTIKAGCNDKSYTIGGIEKHNGYKGIVVRNGKKYYNR